LFTFSKNSRSLYCSLHWTGINNIKFIFIKLSGGFFSIFTTKFIQVCVNLCALNSIIFIHVCLSMTNKNYFHFLHHLFLKSYPYLTNLSISLLFFYRFEI